MAEAFFLPHMPCAPLARFVQFIWIARGAVDYRRERVLPNGVVELIVNLGYPHKVLDRDDYSRETLYRECWVAGIQNQHLVIEAVRDTDLIGIRFRPGGAYPFLGVPLSELTDRVVEFDLIDRALVAELRDKVLEAHDDAQRVAQVERILLGRLDSHWFGHRAVQFVCEQIRAAQGLVRIGDLVADTGLSHRRLIGHFERDVGMRPKALAQIHKFQSVLRRIEGVAEPDWSRIAAECGYYDQPHLNHDFKRLSGLTPSEYVATRLPDINHAIAD